MNRREALKKIGAGSAVGIPAAMFSTANAREADTNDPYEHDMGNVDTDPDYWNMERVEINRLFGMRLFTADGKEVSPDRCSIIWFNTRTGWVGQIGKIKNGEVPQHSYRYPAPLKIIPPERMNTERPLTQVSLEEAAEILRKAGYELEGRIMAIGYRTPDQMENALDGLAETMKTHCRENNVDSAAFRLIISKLPEGEE